MPITYTLGENVGGMLTGLGIPAAVFLAGWLALPSAESEGAEMAESPELAVQRQKMQHRQRRLIYNNDGVDVFLAGANTPDGFLSKRMKPTLDTQVDSVFYNTGATTMFTHRPKEGWGTKTLGEVYGEYIPEGTKGLWGHVKGNIEALAAMGTDALALVIKFCHENDQEVFLSYRINDIHDSLSDGHFELSTWKRKHPEYCLGRREDQDKYQMEDPRWWWSSLDFEIPEVRDYLIAIMDDVLSRYDVDGIEIDYFRAPLFFRPNLEYKPATPEQVKILTGFQRRVRKVAYRAGTGRGRPILVATRVPMTPAVCLHVGIDIKGWLAEGLLDVLTTGGGYAPFTMPTGTLVELGHAHDVPVYPTLSASGFSHQGYDTLEGWRGAAANAWQAGADGMLLWNTFPGQPQHPHFTQLGDPATLAGLDKLFVVDNGKVTKLGCVRQAIETAQILPLKLDWGGESRQVNLPIGDDIAAAAKAGKLAAAPLTVQFGSRLPGDTVQLSVNGEAVAAKEETRDGWVTYDAAPSVWRQGDNALSFRVSARAGSGERDIVVQRVELRVDYR